MQPSSDASSIQNPSRAPSPDPVGGVGLSNPQLSTGRRRMLDLVNKLHNTGVQVDIDLPQIAVIGSQSAGKSSLIESISGITLPRAAGTCTRVPTECRLMRSDGPWQCIVSLRFITDSNNAPLGQARNEAFGPTIYDKAEVEARIRRAQRALLNPNTPTKNFLSGDEDDVVADALSFSKNYVSLQISGPDVADLSFVDLPGLIASVSSSRGNSQDIGLVQSLVTSYIVKPSCIILLTVTCETDFENQGAYGIVKQYDPEGKRTIGVLTKPDRIPIGEEQSWLAYIRNEKESLDNNWFCVKQPSSNDLKKRPTWEQARQMEADFFAGTAPWSELDAVYSKYLRTSNLLERLSDVLSGLISKRLPQIQDELEKAIHATEMLLAGLPRPPSDDPRGEITHLLHVFTNELDKQVKGIPLPTGLLQRIAPAQQEFQKAIRFTVPNFMPFETTGTPHQVVKPAEFLSDEEGGVGISDSSQLPEPIYLDDVMKRANAARTRELPGSFPFVVQSGYIEEVVAQWKVPAMRLLHVIFTVITDYVKDIIKKYFEDIGQGLLEQKVRSIMQIHLKQCFERAESKLEWLLNIEVWPFSMNTHYFLDYRSKFLAYYRKIRQESQHGPIIDQLSKTGDPNFAYSTQTQALATVMAGLAQLGITNIGAADLPKLLPSDTMEPALTIMADVRAYFQVAYKRFTDNVPLAVDFELLRGTHRDVLRNLHSGLGINGPQGSRICQELVQESTRVADKRADLRKKLERLEAANDELLRLGM
ncbi:P-loop containing nucleoside triphosphate hydrolase protein [Panaeolus papilionaceus]|nr:P-loop containing nucleoside triphosphate hydrolase protein [Panaeolus papilionaceus]